MITRRVFIATVGWGLLAAPLVAEVQPPGQVYRVGVVLTGGPYEGVVDGLRDGLRELGLEEGKQFVLDVRDAKGDVKAVADAAKSLERAKVNLIYAVTTTVTTAVKQATATIPIVFAVGSDPVAFGLVESFAKPGGRLTGVHYLSRELTAKRLEILRELLPKLHRIVTFYNPSSPVAREAAKLEREAARQLRIELVQREVASVEDLRVSLGRLRAGEADAYFFVSDAMVSSQAPLIIDTAKARRLPAMTYDLGTVARGALVGYGVNYHEVGRISAKHVQRILAGRHPADLPVEDYSRLGLSINLKTAKALGLTIPQSLLLRADEVIE